jgi:nitroreductase
MTSPKQVLRAIFHAIVPRRWARVLRRPLLVPAEYGPLLAEIEAVICAQREGRCQDDEYWAAVLRKYAHILDKGLQRCDWEPGHSSSIYQLARDALSHIHSPEIQSDPSVAWARERIAEYEELQTCRPESVEPLACSVTTCGYETLLDAIQTRRSLRSYTDQQVPEELLQRVVEVITWAPGSCNRQTVKVFAARRHSLVQACLATCQGATGFGETVPCFLSFCADLRAYELPQELYLPTLDTALGIQNCCLVAHSLGLGITLLSWAQHSAEEERELRRRLEIPSYYQIVVNGVLGYPAQGAPCPRRKSGERTWVVREG